METKHETVYTVTDYWDGPRGGVALYQGKPHVYQALFDSATNDWIDVFLLQPIDDELLELVLEDWAIWKRWEAAYKAGKTTIETHPALPTDHQRHQELHIILSAQLIIDPTMAIQAKGTFRMSDAESGLLVFWSAP